MPLVASIDPLAFCRIVANLTLPQKENKRSLFHVDGDNQRTYVHDLKEYPTRIKKLYIKGNSKKRVPMQMLNIQTNTIETVPSVFFNRVGPIAFQEF